MQLTITTTHQPATDLGYLLHKHPDKVQTFKITSGKVHIFYPEATNEKCTATMLLDIDNIDLVRTLKIPGNSLMLKHYVNDRPYVASSFTSTAIARIYTSALNGKCKDRPEIVEKSLPLEVNIAVLHVHGGKVTLEKIFTPLGYTIETKQHPLDEKFDTWGDSNYYSVTLKNTIPLKDLLTHLYVLLPVFDHEKHYWIGKDEVAKLLEKGKGWLETHPEKKHITRRYLKSVGQLMRMAMDQLTENEVNELELEKENELLTQKIQEKYVSLHQKRLQAVLEQLKKCGAKTIVDLGCGEGKLVKLLLREHQFEKILGMDVSFRELLRAKKQLYIEEMPPKQRDRIELIHGSLTYRDERLAGYDAATLVEVIEHLDMDRLKSLEQVVFKFASPKTVILTTPNAEYNKKYESLAEGNFRHHDHRFEWTRDEFKQWVEAICQNFGYRAAIYPIGEEDERVGASSQMAVFQKKD